MKPMAADKSATNGGKMATTENLSALSLTRAITIVSVVNYGLFLTSQTSQFKDGKKLSLAAVKQHNDLVSENEKLSLRTTNRNTWRR